MSAQTPKLYIYVQAVVDREGLASEGPGAISFRSQPVLALNADLAYLQGQQYFDEHVEFVPEREVVNDYVVAVPRS